MANKRPPTLLLKVAGNAVNKATEMLVASAKEAAFQEPEEEEVQLKRGVVGSAAQEMQAMAHILEKEKELKEAQARLMNIRKKKYQQPDRRRQQNDN